MTETPANPTDKITRYIYSKKLYNSNGAKPGAFTPPKNYPNEISINKISAPDIDDDAIKTLGEDARPDKTLFARADLSVSIITSISDEQGSWLNVLIDGIPQHRHGNIKSIPILQSLRKAITAELATKSCLKRYNIN